jgi:acetyl-CoA carboxylase biotin carboxyl carrier protein
MDIRKIKKLIELLETSGISEIEITEGEERVRISRLSHQPAPASPPASPSSLPPSPPAPAAAPEPQVIPPPRGHTIQAPMVGVFYRASGPDKPPFVEVGQTVKAGDTLCIIEAMKMLNQIQSDREGVIKAILADNATPVEYDQPLFIIE